MDAGAEPSLADQTLQPNRELELREREVRAKEREAAVKENEQRTTAKRNPLLWSFLVALVVAIFGLFTNAYVVSKQNQSNQDIARRKAEADLELQRRKARDDMILEAIRTGNPEKARKNLEFMIQAGLIDDPENKIRNFLAKREPPALPPLGSSVPYQPPKGSQKEFEVQIQDKDGNPQSNARVACNSEGMPDESTTDASGVYVCMIPSNSQTVRIAAVANGYTFVGNLPISQHTIRLTQKSP